MKLIVTFLTLFLLSQTILFSQSFTRITADTIVNDHGYSEGCCWIDFNNDSYLDMFVANRFGLDNFLYKNNGNGSFTKITSGVVVSDSGNSIGNSCGDYDNDGDLDLYVLDLGGKNLFYRNDGGFNFTKITEGEIANDSGWSHSSSWGDYDNDGDLDLFVVNGQNENNILYTNMGDGSFNKVISGNIVTDSLWSHDCCWIDYDNDNDLDLFVVNSYGKHNNLYSNNGDGSFKKIIEGAIVNDTVWSHSCSWADYDNDGDLDVFVANHEYNNLLYENNGDKTFSKIGIGDIVSDSSNSISSSWGDYDNDGDLDLFVANSNNQNNFIYTNNGDKTFNKVLEGDIVNDGGFSESGCWGDYDNDGDLDLFVSNNNNQNNFLYLNNGNKNNWINIKCIGTVSNHSAIGTKVRVKSLIDGQPVWQMREISGQTGYANQNSLNTNFGLGDALTIDSLRIEWPSGIKEEYYSIEINRFITAVENQGITKIEHNSYHSVKQFDLRQNYPNPFNPSTTIEFTLPKSEFTTLKVYNILGKEVSTLISRKLNQGKHTYTFDGKNLASGIYYYQLEAGDYREVKKMILLK